MKPAPWRAVVASAPPSNAGDAVNASADLTCFTVHVGCRCVSSAAAPATWGAAMLVPEKAAQVPRRTGTDDRIWTPGAVTSGFSWSEIGVGPADEKSARRASTVEAAAVMAERAAPGDAIEPRPKAPKSFPAAITGTTPAAAA